MGGDLYALDFDGILCDSCGESSLSALKLRPVVETGYENLLLVRLLLEIQIPSIRKSSVADGLSIQAILENWLQLKPVIMKEWNEERDALIDLFGKVRDEWIRNDFSGWIGANRPKVEVLKQLQSMSQHDGLKLQEVGIQHREREGGSRKYPKDSPVGPH
ncbi:hypothetical protein ACMD2_12812 [Ananas comosus]|uniref:Uncharacterized protein n=1 Tax=Ananas comosus TaxID=4615 RepID=A0A199V5Z8_ANACO|nr:hypothetical protein ACMD2_12812 [Ananas comosus]